MLTDGKLSLTLTMLIMVSSIVAITHINPAYSSLQPQKQYMQEKVMLPI